MNESKEVDFHRLIAKMEDKLEEFKIIKDNSHNLLNFYFDKLFKEINEQSYEAYKMLSDHFNKMLNAVRLMKNELLENVPNEPMNTRMIFWTMNAEEFLDTNNWSPSQCFNLFKQEQDITAVVTKKFFEYMDFKKVLLTPIRDNLDMNSLFGQLILKDFFYLVLYTKFLKIII